MGSEKFELTDISNSQTNLTMVPGQKKSGCYVSAVAGFILVLLAVAIAVGVGIIVHFAGNDRDFVCNCGDGALSGGATADAIKQECMDLAAAGDAEICQKCTSATTSKPGTTAPGQTTAPAVTTTVSPTTPVKVTDVRLPDSLYPVHYDVELQPNMYVPDVADFTFKGSVNLMVGCLKATNNITLHAWVLEVNKSSIRFGAEISGSDDPEYLSWEIDTDRQFFIVKLTKNMMPGRKYWVAMSFVSPLEKGLKGLYLSQYSRGNETVYLSTTQFQPTDARRAFPCFDEPAIKATFNITLVRPIDRISISNMPIIDNQTTFVEDGIQYVKDVYQKTPKMSSYLLAFVVSDFKYTSNYTSRNVLYRAWATPESVDQTHYALDVGVKILTYFEDYFEINFPLPKQDMIAIPDFAAGAMENWGLITYRETAMLYQPGISNEMNKERVAIVVSHELAHQWFGDLVTPSWWDDLWLNEGFASFVEYLGVDHVHPDWRMFEKFVVSDLQNAFDFDGLISSHPVYVPVGHPDEINEIFDTISYAKGASIIRMMRHFLGYDTFKKGLTRYLNNKAYDAAFHDDLWEALTAQARIDRKNIDVKEVMDTWTLQMNYPVVTVTRDFNDLNSLHFRQERFLSNPTAEDPGKYESPFDYHWTIPVTITSSAELKFNKTWQDIIWLNKDETAKSIQVPAGQLPADHNKDAWILANLEQNGYYRVNYQIGNWIALTSQLKRDHQVIPVINRAQIINDAWNLASAGFIGLDIALMTIEYLDKEREYVPWYAARDQLDFVKTMLSLTGHYGAFQRFMQNKVNSSYNDYGLRTDGAGHVEVYARSLIAGQACGYGIQSCLDAASDLLRQWMSNPAVNPVDPNLKSVVYCYAIANGGWEEWDFALRMYKEANVASEKSYLLSAMGCSKKPWILNHYLELLLVDDTPIRSQDALSVIGNVAYNNIGRSLAWNFFRGKYTTLKDLFGDSFFAWTRVIGSVTESFNTPFELQEVLAFRDSQSGNLGSGARAFDQALEKIDSRIKWMDKNLPVISKWLDDGGY